MGARTVRIQLHAHAADLAGARVAELSLADTATAGDVKRALGQAFPALADLLATAALATDHEYLRDSAPAGRGDELPPRPAGERRLRRSAEEER